MNRIRTKTGTKPCNNVDIHKNPDMPETSRIPVCTDIHVLEDYLKNEIIAAKWCACPSCQRKRIVLRRFQEILAEYKRMKATDRSKCATCPVHKK